MFFTAVPSSTNHHSERGIVPRFCPSHGRTSSSSVRTLLSPVDARSSLSRPADRSLSAILPVLWNGALIPSSPLYLGSTCCSWRRLADSRKFTYINRLDSV
jgi:hypothetical protein